MSNLLPKLYNLSWSKEFYISFLKWWWLSSLQCTSTVPCPFIICGTLMKSNYALASFPLRCNLDHLSKILRRELPWRLKENTCFNQCKGSLSWEPASLLALCNLKYGVTYLWTAFLARIFSSKKSGIAWYTDLYLHKRKRKNGQEYEMLKEKTEINWHPTLVTNTASITMPLNYLGTLNKTSYIKILIY